MTDRTPTEKQIERALRRGAGSRTPAGASSSTADSRAAAGASRSDRSGARGGGGALGGSEARVTAAAAARRVSDRLAAEGLADVTYAALDSPFGALTVATTKRGLVRVAFPEEDVDVVLARLASRLSPRIVQATAPLDDARRELEEYFDGRRRRFDVRVDWTLVGPFGRRVLGVTSRIPYGRVLTYAEVAADAGSPRGSRAAGNALGANPIPIVVPCHRVLRTGGALGGYGGGLDRKRWLLELEGALTKSM